MKNNKARYIKTGYSIFSQLKCVGLLLTVMLMIAITAALALPTTAAAEKKTADNLRVSEMPATADSETLAANEPQSSGPLGDNLTWSYDAASKTLTISGSGEMIDFSSADPPWFESFGSQIQKVVLEDEITSIADYAFAGCSSLSGVTIGSSVVSIGDYTFADCSSLSSITISQKVSSLGDYVFYQCSSLTEINVAAANQNFGSVDGVLFSKDKKNLLIYPAGKTAASYAVPDGVTVVGNMAFAFCSNLSSITIADSVSSLGNSAFMYCSSLSGITIPDGVTSIDEYTFAYCRSLESVIMGDEVGNIGEYAFAYCSSLSSIKIPDGVISIGDYAFSNCSSLSSAAVGDSVTSIGEGAFNGCSSLSNIAIPQNVSSLGECVFLECSSLTKINVAAANETFRSVEGVMFSKDGQTLLVYPAGKTDASYAIPDGVITVGYAAFGCCSNLSSITLGDSVTSIGDNAFRDCSSLSSVTISDGVTSIGNSAFRDCSSLSSITIPNGVIAVGHTAFASCCNLSSVTIGNNVISIESGAFEDCSSLSSITIPASVTSIGSYAFNGCSSLSSITIPASVTSIGSYAFNNCSSLSSITIPDGVTRIGARTFSNCSSLSSITIPDGVTNIGSYAFNNCSSLSSLIIPDGVTEIDKFAFAGCSSLGQVIIGKNVSNMGDQVCVNCPELAAVYCYGAAPDVSAADSENASFPTTATIYYIEGKDGWTEPTWQGYNTKSLTELAAPQVKAAAKVSAGQCKIFWKAVPGAQAYEIYRAASEQGAYYLVQTTKKVSYVDSAAALGDNYYKVAAIARDQENYAACCSKIVKCSCALAQPQVKGSNDAATGYCILSWQEIKGVTQYEIWRADSSRGKYVLQTAVAAGSNPENSNIENSNIENSYTDDQAAAGRTYCYKIKAIAADQQFGSADSRVIIRTCDLPQPVVNAALNAQGQPSLSWEKVDGAVKYQVFRATSADGRYKLIKTTSKTAFVDNKADKAAQYYYKVKALAKRPVANSACSAAAEL